MNSSLNYIARNILLPFQLFRIPLVQCNPQISSCRLELFCIVHQALILVMQRGTRLRGLFVGILIHHTLIKLKVIVKG